VYNCNEWWWWFNFCSLMGPPDITITIFRIMFANINVKWNTFRDNSVIVIMNNFKRYQVVVMVWLTPIVNKLFVRKHFQNWPIDSPPSCPGLHGLRIACLNTYYNMKAIALHYNMHRSTAGHNPYNLFILTIVYSKNLPTS